MSVENNVGNLEKLRGKKTLSLALPLREKKTLFHLFLFALSSLNARLGLEQGD